jgi:hypothetical protein
MWACAHAHRHTINLTTHFNMNPESNETLEQRVARLEDTNKNIFEILQSTSIVLGKLGDSTAYTGQVLLQLWNGQIALVKFIMKTSPAIDEPTRQSFLTMVARMESQTENLEAIMAAFKKTSPN